MFSNNRLKLVMEFLKKNLLLFGFFSCFLVLTSCGNELEITSKNPYMIIEDGIFEVQSMILDTLAESAGPDLGSGTLSFKYSGDIEGTFSASGPLVENQTESGVGAVLSFILFNTQPASYLQGLELIAFNPTGNGKADALILFTKNGLQSITAGDIHGVGSLEEFSVAFFTGLKISDFWKAEKNFVDVADKAFFLQGGALAFTSKNENEISGTFVGTTDVNRASTSNRYILP